ncbi:MAG: transpeptidase family protein [Spirochaetales bacterium]|nr:transpeptidase family protein [Spirochaetales bacterium]
MEEKKNFSRLGVVLIILGIAVLLILWRYISLMLLTPNEIENPARQPVVERGPILDRNGRILAIQTELDSVTAWKPEIESNEEIAAQLAPVLGIPEQSILDILSRQSSFAYIKRKITQSESIQVRRLINDDKLKGINLQREFDRTYPEEHLASHVLGIVDVDNRGLEGLELSYDSLLRPEITDSGAEIVYGNQLFLTLDVNIQYLTETVAREAMEEHEADSVMILVMDAQNGDLLAVASVPDFNPNVYGNFPVAYRQNRPAVAAYEPGSVFKIFSIAALLEVGGISSYSSFVCGGSYENPDIPVPIKCLGVHGQVNAADIIKYSCNAGAAYASDSVEAPVFHDMLVRFGFGTETALPFPGESNGLLKPASGWSARSKPTIAFGQEISTSAVQVITAATAFTNDGYVLEPHIVKKIVSPAGDLLEETMRKPLVDALSPETARAMLLMMETATQTGGTARRAAIEGVRVSAKTGTAQVFDPVTGSYSTQDFTASCLAVFPTDAPEIIIYVVIEHPKAGETYGGRIAAPVVSTLGESIVDYLNIPRSGETAFSHDGTVRIHGLPPIVLGDALPDLTGYSKRQLLPLLDIDDVKVTISGSGWVVRQEPAAGTPVRPGIKLLLELE